MRLRQGKWPIRTSWALHPYGARYRTQWTD